MTVGTFFDGVNDYIESNTGTDLASLTAYTIGGLTYLGGAGRGTWFLFDNGATPVLRVISEGGAQAIERSSDFPFIGSGYSSGSWYLWFVTKAAGTVAPRFHVTSDGSSWTHAAADAGTMANPGGVITVVRLGGDPTSGEWVSQEIATVGLWGEDTSDGTIETYTNYNTLAAKSNKEFFTDQSLISGGTMNDSSSHNNDETSRVGATTGSQTIPAWFTNFGADTNVTVQSAAVGVAANAATVTRNDAYAVSSAGAAITASASPSVTFAGTYTPLENDVIVFFFSSTSAIAVVANASLPSGWVNPLGDGVENNSDTCGIGCLYHKVTSTEAGAGTLTYTATSSITSTTGYVQAAAIRNVDPANVVDGSGVAVDTSNTVTPHVLAGITGSGVLIADSLVVSSVTKDSTGAYSSIPGGWQQLRADNTNQGRWLGYRDAPTVLDTNVTATNITPSAGDEYASITLAFSRAPAGGTNVTIPAAAGVTVTANNSSHDIKVNVGVAAVSTTANGVNISRRIDVGSAAVTVTANNSSASVKPTTGTAAVTTTANNSSASVASTIGTSVVTVVGNNATVSTTTATNVDVGVAAVTATVNNSSAAVAGGIGSAAVTATGNNVTAAPSPSAGNAAVTATANNSSASIKPTTGSAAVTATANNSSSSVASTIGTSVVTVTGNNATPATTTNVNVDVGSAAVTVTGNDSSASVKPTTGSAAVTVAGNQVTVSTDASKQVAVGVAAVSATANNPGSSIKPTTQLAAVTVVGNNVGHELTVTAGVSTVGVAANNSSAAVAAAVVAALVLVVANNLQPDNGEGVSTLIGLIRASRPDLTRVSRPYPHRVQRPEA